MGMEDDILKDFLAESKENLERLDQEFVELEENPQNEDLIKSIFRTIHTIKGTAGFFGFTTLEGIAHFAEDILSKLRDKVIGVNEEITTMLLKAVDHIKAILASLESTGKEPDDIAYLDFIVDLRNFAERVVKGRALKTPQSPPAPAAEEKTETVTGPASEETSQTSDGSDQPSRVDEGRQGSAMETPPASAPVSTAGPGPRQVNPPAAEPPASAHQLTETHVRVDVQLLDRLMNLAGELVLSRNRLAQIAGTLNNPDLMAANQRTSLIVTELQEQIMKTRMQPVGNVFNKFPRIVRDLAKAAGKQIQLRIEGAETELDRSIIEVIKDPLTHMVRNSVDHGIEAPDIRIQKEKPPSGTLVMRAYHEGGQVIIEIQDDGAGIDPARIRTKAVEKGIITEAQARTLPDRDAVQLVFHPGFSTAEEVTNISGRGVGMDVVKTNIERLGGTVELLSEKGHGTTVKIKIPLTLAIIPALIVRSGGQRYAIPQVNLVELVHLGREALERDVQTIGGSEFYRLRGEILPLVRLEDVLGSPGGRDRRDDLSIVVLSTGDRQFGLVVDGISDSEEIVVKPLGKHIKHIPCYAGTTLMGDGRVALILDVMGIAASVNLKGEERLREAEEKDTAVGEERQFILLFSLDPAEVFAIPLALVNRLDKISASQIENIGGQEVIQYRGTSMPVIRLEHHLPIRPIPEMEEYHIVVFHMNKRDIAFLVGRIEDSLNLAVDVDDRVYKGGGILGSAIVKDRTTLFLDVYQIISRHDPGFFAMPAITEAGRGRILLAEDSTFYRNLLSSYVEAAGYEVVTAEDGLEAWEIISEDTKGPFDLLVTDIDMPRMNGLELAAKVRGSERYRDLPIVAVTSLSSDDDKRRGIQAGINDYQVKLDRDHILGAIRDLLSGLSYKEAA